MCRLLALHATAPFDANPWIDAFAERCRASHEYQGHGWGAAWRTDGGWDRTRSIDPIWEPGRTPVPEASVVVVHARSAFRNEGIVVENNMPFVEDDLAFAFNGELRGVRLTAPGETGAHRLCHLLDRFRRTADADLESAVERLDDVMTRRSDHIRAMNIVAADRTGVVVHSHFADDPDYFTLHQARVRIGDAEVQVASSEPFSMPGLTPAWNPLPNHSTIRLPAGVSC